MPIIFSTTTPASPACQPPARIYFEAPDDALLARVTERVAELMGRHLSYIFHDKAPGGVTPIILEDVGPSALPVETTVVNYPHAAGVVPGSLLLKEYPSGHTLTDNGRGHLIDQDGRSAATVDYETGTIHQPQAIPDALTERGAKAWAGVDAQGLRDNFTAADMATAEARGFRDGVASVAADAGSEPVTQPSDADAILSKICDLFHIGKLARTESTILTNIGNVIDHAGLLHAVERDLFPQPELPEDDDPYAAVDEGLPAPNSWAAKDEADYVAQFRAALAARGFNAQGLRDG